MGKQFCIGVFVSLLVLLSSFQKTEAQCTPGFLGEDKAFIMCSETVTIDYSFLFQVAATYIPVALSPFDTLKGTGNQADTIIAYKAKIQVIAVLENGCKDTAIVRIPLNIDPYPDAGRDTTITICPRETFDLSTLRVTSNFEASWSVENFKNVGEGVYTYTVTTRDGCTDQAIITIQKFPDISFGDDIAVILNKEQKADLTTLFQGIPLQIVWSSPNPSSVSPGGYWAIGTDENGCKDTVLIEVCQKPNLGNDTTIYVCTGSTRNLYTVFSLSGLIPRFNTFTPSTVGFGTYQIIVKNYCGGEDTALISVLPFEKPEIGPDIEVFECADQFVNLNLYYDLPGLTRNWNTNDPESAKQGTYRVVGINEKGCSDTAFLTVKEFPRRPDFNDTTVYICYGQTQDLNKIYEFGEEIFADWENATNPSGVSEGVYYVSFNYEFCFYRLKVTVLNGATRSANIEVCTFNTTTTGGLFTTNRFRSVIVDKQGQIWAGADGDGSTGGVYRFIPDGQGGCLGGIWSASNKFGNSSYRDLHLSTLEGDNTVWSASSGYNPPIYTLGGVYQINSLQDVKRYGSKMPNDNTGSLSSRNVISLAISPDGFLYAGSGVTLGEDEFDGAGDVYRLNLRNQNQGFIRVSSLGMGLPEDRVSALGIVDDELWVAVQRRCYEGLCDDPFISRIDLAFENTREPIAQFNSSIPFSDRNDIIIRSIFQSSTGRVFIGLNGGLGFAVREPIQEGQQPLWWRLDHSNSAFPRSALVNFNAITEVNGEIWIGTTQGLLVYDGVGPLTECSSYILYNTTNGLPSNNITDVAYDKERMEVWITSDAGVSRVAKNFGIEGRIVNVFYGRYTKELLPQAVKRPLKGVKVTMYDKSGSKILETETNESGDFRLNHSFAGDAYKVQMTYNGLTYEYTGVKPNTFLGIITFPDSLLQDISNLKDTLKQRKFSFNAAIPEAVKGLLLGYLPAAQSIDGFDVTDLENLFLNSDKKILYDHEKWVENLSLYYLTLCTINDIGIMASDLVNDGGGILGEAVISFFETLDAIGKINKFYKVQTAGLKPEEVEYLQNQATIGLIEAAISLKAWAGGLLSDFLTKNLQGSDKAISTFFSTAISSTIDFSLDLFKYSLDPKHEKIFDFKKFLVKQGSRFLGSLAGSGYYKYYTRILHSRLINDLSLGVRLTQSDENYRNVYTKAYDKFDFAGTGNVSILGKAIHIYEHEKNVMQFAKEMGETAQFYDDLTDGVGKLLTVTGIGAPVGAALRVVNFAVKGASIGAKLGGAVVGIGSGINLGINSEDVVPLARLNSFSEKSSIRLNNYTPLNAQNFNAISLSFIQELRALQNAIDMPYDATSLLVSLDRFNKASQAYRQQQGHFINLIKVRIADASEKVPGFDDNLEILFKDYLIPQGISLNGIFLEFLGHLVHENKEFHKWELMNLIEKTVLETSGINSSMSILVDNINEYQIEAPASLVKISLNNNTNYLPGGSGVLEYEFMNFGNESINDLKVEVSNPTGGFTFSGTQIFEFSVISPLEKVSIKVPYLAPNYDTIGGYIITAANNNQIWINEEGVLIVSAPTDNTAPISIKSGLWSDPTTWSTGLVPDATSAVIIRHEVTIDIDANCKSIRAENPAQVQVAAGKKLTVLE